MITPENPSKPLINKLQNIFLFEIYISDPLLGKNR
jgi:hypothetical protein